MSNTNPYKEHALKDTKALREIFHRSNITYRKREVPTSNIIIFTQDIIKDLFPGYVSNGRSRLRIMTFFLSFPGLRVFSAVENLGTSIYLIDKKRYRKMVKRNLNRLI